MADSVKYVKEKTFMYSVEVEISFTVSSDHILNIYLYYSSQTEDKANQTDASLQGNSFPLDSTGHGSVTALPR